MALSIDYMPQNGYTFVGIFTKTKYPSESKVWMEIVTDGTRTDLVQFTRICGGTVSDYVLNFEEN